MDTKAGITDIFFGFGDLSDLDFMFDLNNFLSGSGYVAFFDSLTSSFQQIGQFSYSAQALGVVNADGSITSATTVPEPSTIVLLGVAFVLLYRLKGHNSRRMEARLS